MWLTQGWQGCGLVGPMVTGQPRTLSLLDWGSILIEPPVLTSPTSVCLYSARINIARDNMILDILVNIRDGQRTQYEPSWW